MPLCYNNTQFFIFLQGKLFYPFAMENARNAFSYKIFEQTSNSMFNNSAINSTTENTCDGTFFTPVNREGGKNGLADSTNICSQGICKIVLCISREFLNVIFPAKEKKVGKSKSCKHV